MIKFFDPKNKHFKPVYPVLLLFFLMLSVAWYKWIILGGYAAPPGSDGGQWLAFGHQLFTGETVKAGFQSYPPLLPSIVKIASTVLTPLEALKVTGIFTSVFIAIPVYLILRRTLIPVIAIALAITATLTPFNSEVLSFGGYPQLLGSSFLLFSLYFLTLGFETRGKRWFFAASLAASATIGSNVFPSFLLIIASLLIVLFYLFRMRCESKAILYHRIRSAFLCWVLPSIVLVIPFIKSYFAYLSESASSEATTMHWRVIEITGWVNSSWLFEFTLWFVVASIMGALLILLGKTFFNKQIILASTSISILIATIIGVFVIPKLRFVGFIEISLILVLGFLPGIVKSLVNHLKVQKYFVRVMLIFTLACILTVGTLGYRRLLIASDWYQVVTPPVIGALDWLSDNGDLGSIVVTTGTERGHVYGWWIEGYSHLPAYTAGDPLLFFSEEERTQVEIAQNILIDDTSSSEIEALVEQHQIRYLFLDKNIMETSHYKLVRAGFKDQFENQTILIMENTNLNDNTQ